MVRPLESERKDIRSMVLEKAKELFLEYGYEKITMRQIAKEIGVSAASIYLYYKNKNEILYELHNEGFRRLYEQKMKLQENGPINALEKLKAGGLMYAEFILKHRDYFELMFNMPEPHNFMEEVKEKQQIFPGDYGMKSFEFLKNNIIACQKEGYFQDADPNIAAFTLWSVINGMVSLIFKNRVPDRSISENQLAENVIDFLGSLFKSTKQ